MRIKTILFAVLFCVAGNLFSFINYESGELSFDSSCGVYILPNENVPELGVPIWKETNDGIYVSVGTERGFIGAAISNASHLLLLDRDPGVVSYNKMIIQLLKLAENGEDFRKLRTDFSYLEEKILAARGSRHDLDFAHIDFMQANDLWKLVVNYSMCQFDGRRLHWMWRADIERSDVRYWENDVLFSKLQAMALNDQIQAEKVDWTDTQALTEINEQLFSAQLEISVIDFSNTQMPTYLGPNGVNTVVEIWESVLKPESVLLFTWFHHDDFCPHLEYAGFFKENFSPEIFHTNELLYSQSVVPMSKLTPKQLNEEISCLEKKYLMPSEGN